jgi:competence protein ComEC
MGSSSSLIGIPNGSEWERSRLERLKQALLESCRLQWIVTIALIPCTLYWFYQVSIVSPLANALAIPVISFIVTPLAIAGAILPEWFAPILLQLAHEAMEWTATYLNWLAKFDWAVHWAHQPTLWAMALSTVGIYWHIRPGPMTTHLVNRIVGLALCAPLFWQTTNAIHEGQFRAYVRQNHIDSCTIPAHFPEKMTMLEIEFYYRTFVERGLIDWIDWSLVIKT